VTLKPAHRLNVHRTYTLTVLGEGPTGVASPGETPLDGAGTGHSGSNFTTKLTWRALSIPGDAPAVTFANGQAHAYTGSFGSYTRSILHAARSVLHSVARPDAKTRHLSHTHRAATANSHDVKNNAGLQSSPEAKGTNEHKPTTRHPSV
jgi:hypothetical protein